MIERSTIAGTIGGRSFISLILLVVGHLGMRVSGPLYLQLMKLRRRNTKWPAEVWDGKPVLLYFSTLQCSVCKYQQAKDIKNIQKHFTKKGLELEVRKFDAGERVDLSDLFGVVTVPTTVILDDKGEIAAHNSGLAKKKVLIAQLEEILAV